MPLIFDIRHFALDDGPGIRSTVFMKGCPLSCVWCHNPESISSAAVIAFYEDRCIGCGTCREVCPEGAVSIVPGTERVIRDKCTVCGACCKECPSTALSLIGASHNVDDLVDRLLRERIFYDTSGGGVTFSGGEPTLFMDYVGAVMQRLKREGIHVALQTSGMFNLEEFREKLHPYIDIIFFDLKLLDEGRHRKFTGRGNGLILENFVYLARNASVPVVPRIPLVPGITATMENLAETAAFLRKTGCFTATLLPYNPGGITKTKVLGKKPHPALPNRMTGIEEEEDIKAFFRHRLAGHSGKVKEPLSGGKAATRGMHAHSDLM
ncbi:Pyruvate formate-lyase activating enzyme [hydrothermal vent metagenome]|uniref:Pyruvate formate-lyase activating enzyme n=1 Tax=hydrothermal vent metagenome TaxID=652676 RepID=A0A3B1D6Y6_9ZZZZ